VSQNFFADDVGAVLSETIAESGGPVYVVNPTLETVPDIVSQLHEEDGSTAVNLLAANETLKEVMGDFIVAGHASDLVVDDVLSVRLIEDRPEASLFVADGLVVSLVHVDERVGGLTTSEASFVDRVLDHYGDRWEGSEQFQIRTPSVRRVRETLSEEIGPEVTGDFDAILSELDVARGDGEGLDEVTISILAGARHGVLLYDISRWGEDIGLASKATFSRTKSRLEESGIVRTEKVPIDVGRPRLRLRLTEDGFWSASIPELTERVQQRLAEE
jgi:hypothetical protein